jgi:enoyl-CoA hydratase/carnithine racemase
VRRVPQLSIEAGFKEMAVLSRHMFGTPEAAEGMAAFREKRKPSWVREN